MTLEKKLCKKCKVVYKKNLIEKMSAMGKASANKLTKEQRVEKAKKASYSRKIITKEK